MWTAETVTLKQLSQGHADELDCICTFPGNESRWTEFDPFWVLSGQGVTTLLASTDRCYNYTILLHLSPLMVIQ